MPPQLHMTAAWRHHLLKQHEFFVQQMRKRILAQFSNIEAEADKYASDEFERLGNLPGSEHDYRDLADVAETANENAIEFYSLLNDLRKQATLSAIAGMYHQWEKELRKFLELEMRHHFKPDAVMRYVWVKDVANLFDILKAFGWDCTALAFFPKLDACRLVVNVYKHGKGRSLTDLGAKFPQYLDNPMKAFKFFDRHLDHEWLDVSDPQASEFAAAIREFWTTFPELLYWQGPQS